MSLNNTPNNTSCANKVKSKIIPITKIENPTDDQSFIFYAIRDYRIRDYFVAIMNLVDGPNNIIVASKVSYNRYVFFLSSAELVDSFIKEKGGFQIEQDFVQCRKLRSPTK